MSVDDHSNPILNIRCANGSIFTVESPLDLSIHDFKLLIAGKCDVPADRQRLIHRGRVLKDEQTLASYGVGSDHTIHLVRSIAPASSTTSSANSRVSRAPRSLREARALMVERASTASSTTSSTMTTTNSRASRTARLLREARSLMTARLPRAPSSMESAGSPNGSAGTSASGLFGAPRLSLIQIQYLTQNPSRISEIGNLPVMQHIINNPETMRNFIMNNPQMRQIIDQNPEVGYVLNDPSILQQTLEAARNPELMREITQNTDGAVSNIESSSEGFNMLQRIYETVQPPFLSAATAGGDSGSDTIPNLSEALLENLGVVQSGDNSRNSVTSTELTVATAGSPAPNANPLPNPWNRTSGGTQTVYTRSNLASNARAAGIAGMTSGRGLRNLERLRYSMLDSPPTQVMQNPATTQLTQNQIRSFNPTVSNLSESNPQFSEMLPIPESLREQLLSLQQSPLSQVGQQQPREQNRAGGDTMPPEERYAAELAQLQEMGFFDTQENIRALIASAGNVHAAVGQLLGNFLP